MSTSYRTLSDGQLAATSTTILTAPGGGSVVGVSLNNVAYSQQIVLLHVTRPGGTARRIMRIVLEKNESHYVVGLPLSPSDTLSGESTSAEAIDYVVALSSGPFSMFTRDASGFPKNSSALEVSLPDDGNLTGGDVKVIGVLEEIRDVLLKIA